jgi:hypothetical protein
MTGPREPWRLRTQCALVLFALLSGFLASSLVVSAAEGYLPAEEGELCSAVFCDNDSDTEDHGKSVARSAGHELTAQRAPLFPATHAVFLSLAPFSPQRARAPPGC